MRVFDGDPQARAKDRDRDRATYVIDAALRGGRITQQDRDLRVERASSAATIGELEALTRDLATPPAPVPPTAVVPPPAPAADEKPKVMTGPVPGVPADLYGPPPSQTTSVSSGSGVKVKVTSGRKAAFGCSLIAAMFCFVPVLFGVFIFSTFQSGGTDVVTVEPTPVGPPFELTGPGIRDYVAAFEESFGSTEVVRSVFYDGYVVSWVPQGEGEVAIVNYVDGAFDQLGDPLTDNQDTPPVDLADLRPGRVMALVRETETFALQGEVTTYVIYDRDVIEGTPQVMVYVNDSAGKSGYVIGDLDGRVLTRSEPS